MKHQNAYASLALAAATVLTGSLPASAAVFMPPSLPGFSIAEGTFAPWAPGNTATTYDPALVPVGATAKTVVAAGADDTRTVLRVNGLLPNREYGAHTHVGACGATGAAAGPHYQNRLDPVTPSVDPAYANPANEIWLDFTTNGAGAAASVSSVDWKVRPGGARSITIHAMHTHTEPGQAGVAGARLACINVNFTPAH